MAKLPKIGKVKTRLARSIGDKQALNCYIELLHNCIQEATRLDDVILYLGITPDESVNYAFWQELKYAFWKEHDLAKTR